MNEEMLSQLFLYAKSWEVLKDSYRDIMNDEEEIDLQKKEVACDMFKILKEIEREVLAEMQGLTEEEEK